MSSKVNYVTFKCMNPDCGVTDVLKLYPDESHPDFINCWKCHGGRGKTVDEQRILRTGMTCDGLLLSRAYGH